MIVALSIRLVAHPARLRAHQFQGSSATKTKTGKFSIGCRKSLVKTTV
jgi:hypothetical protein